MANLASKTRKQLVLEYLEARSNEWVPGLELMNQYVGGLRAGARIYELRQEGYDIRTSSDPNSDVDRYMLVDRPLFSSHHADVSKPIGKVVDVEESETGVTMTMEPYVQWKRGKGTSSTASYNGFDLWVEQIVGGQWLWRAAWRNGTKTQVDRAASESLAKRAAILAALTS